MVRITLVTNNPRKTVLAEESKTVKQILEENDVNYGNAATSIDGATLNAGEINKSLKELGVAEKAVISVLAHKDNAAKAIIAGSACVVTSALTTELIQKYKKFMPEMLTMYDEDDEPVFGISLDEEGPGSIDMNGAIFGATKDSEGHATITVLLDPMIEDAEEAIMDKIGKALLYLNEMEEELLANAESLKAKEAEIRANIVKM